MRASSWWVVLAVAGWMGCGPQGPTYHQDIAPLIEARCGSCHVEEGIAPFPLTTYQQVLEMRVPIRHAVEQRTMPPYLAARGCTDYADDQTLSDEQIALIADWVAAGGPEGKPGTAVQSLANSLPGLTRSDLTLKMPVTYTPVQSPDDYRCFLIDWPETTTRYVTGFKANPGNQAIVHHVIAYLIPPQSVAEYQKLDDDEPGPGYTCFGSAGGSGQAAWLGAWAPGGPGTMYPEGTGLPVPPGSKVALQVHYNTGNGPGEDSSSVEFAVADEIRRKASLMPWTNGEWVRGKGMEIPAYAEDVSHSFSFDPTPYMGLITQGVMPSGEAIRIHTASLHQHTLGTKGRLEIRRADGSNECLLDIPRWDFHWQRDYPFTKAKILRPGDELAITCHWNNGPNNQQVVGGQRATPRDVKWGEGTFDEMCLGILYVSE